MNSIIVPVYGDHSCPDVSKMCEEFSKQSFEVIFVSGCESPEIQRTVESFEYQYLLLEGEQSRGVRMHYGFLASTGEVVLFHHPRSVIEPAGLEYYSNMSRDQGWGGFTHKFDTDHPFLRWTSWYSNYIRAARSILYLDHGIFASRKLLELVGGVPRLEIFEDTCLSINLRKHKNSTLLPYNSMTSAVRFMKNGFVKQSIINQFMKFGFYFRIPKAILNKRYEKNIALNSDYDEEGVK